ncbi:MAG: hydroxyacylglutathione hydrolase, partial [Gammaproteobacteria bacterium]
MLEVSPIRAFYDNYFWLFREKTSRECGIVDPGDAGPVISYLEANDLELSVILITHHHADHTGGISALRERFDMPVYGPESPNIPEITYPLRDGDIIDVLDTTFRIIEIPGHTLDHIAYHADGLNGQDAILFCGDTLFAGGCGRVFEGTHAMMHQSLKKLADLAGETKVFCAHEYTMANLAFANT